MYVIFFLSVLSNKSRLLHSLIISIVYSWKAFFLTYTHVFRISFAMAFALRYIEFTLKAMVIVQIGANHVVLNFSSDALYKILKVFILKKPCFLFGS